MYGDLELVESKPGKGSKFKFTFRCGIHHAAENSDLKPSQKLPGSEVLVKKKILIVEDSPDNQLLIEKYLIDTRAEITFANNGKEGF